ncbi:uncharacterized protein K452DRAFT_292438 [Aplosporella prunicola CBS 121167]|uniref:DUF3835 domain-containing protein n=1 Tax=Aplosporella prunicola CBS 121167 TaxID=1176127 RepID=A0A6A6AXD4_9PEZI|nr:uncharacterized protein K452DRAFT_292438 [Aplosporella prunicola CBS 121167]KAF2136410.1 hypothetical protein K452DRAFT_292438 [Aplosporella prunicola CBS 121167]
MAAAPKDSFTDLERHRLRLEDQIAKLRKSLQHWQTWDVEYEGLKEEIEGFKGEPSTQDMMKIGQDFGGDLVNDKEMRELLGVGKGVARDAKQVVHLISRRQDYVQQNIQTVQKQVDAAEDKLNKVLIIASPNMNDEEGNPLTDIREELDEQGNVISSSVATPGQSAPKIVEALRKAGITDLNEDAPETSKPGKEDTAADSEAEEKPEASTSAAAPKNEPAASPVEEKPPKKSVSFAADTKEDAPPPKQTSKNPAAALGNFTKGRRVIEVDEDDNEIGSTPIIPDDESPEDAAMRREMLQYGMNEVGAVVAELDLYEGNSDDEPYYDEDEEASDIEEIDEEDEWGRSTRPVITEAYRQEMLELERRLNARMMENVGPAPAEREIVPEDADLNNMLQQAQGAHRLVVRSDTSIPEESAAQPTAAATSATTTEPAKADASTAKKGVRFAADLDISPAPQPETYTNGSPSTTTTTDTTPTAPTAPTIADAIVERHSAPSSAPSAPAPTPNPKKLSRFKAARAAAAAETTETSTPSPPPNRTLAPSIVERSAPTSASQAPEPEDTDPALLARELATEYHRARNRLIQKQGGFVEEEVGEEPLMEEREDGRVRKVSRFRAARLRGEGV